MRYSVIKPWFSPPSFPTFPPSHLVAYLHDHTTISKSHPHRSSSRLRVRRTHKPPSCLSKPVRILRAVASRLGCLRASRFPVPESSGSNTPSSHWIPSSGPALSQRSCATVMRSAWRNPVASPLKAIISPSGPGRVPAPAAFSSGPVARQVTLRPSAGLPHVPPLPDAQATTPGLCAHNMTSLLSTN